MAHSRGAQTGPVVFNFNGCNIQIGNPIIQPAGAPAQGRTFPTAGIGRPVTTKIPAAAPAARISAPTNRPRLYPAGRISAPTKPKPSPVAASRPNKPATLVRPKANNGGAANVQKVKATQNNVTGKPKDKVHVGHAKPKDKVHVGHAKPAVKCPRAVTCHRH